MLRCCGAQYADSKACCLDGGEGDPELTPKIYIVNLLHSFLNYLVKLLYRNKHVFLVVLILVQVSLLALSSPSTELPQLWICFFGAF